MSESIETSAATPQVIEEPQPTGIDISTQRTARILSIDVGLKHLAYCVIRKDSNDNNRHFTLTVEEWSVIDVSNNGHVDVKHIESMSASILRNLHTRFGDREINHVVIENQPANKNPSMKTVQIIIHTYFMVQKALLNHPSLQKAQIHLYAAMNKLKPSRTVPKATIEALESQPEISKVSNKYSRRKKLGVAIIDHLIANSSLILTSDTQDVYDKAKKRDDLADCLLQGIHYAS